MRDIKPANPGKHNDLPENPDGLFPDKDVLGSPPVPRGVHSFDISRKASTTHSLGRKMRKGSLQPGNQPAMSQPEIGAPIEALPEKAEPVLRNEKIVPKKAASIHLGNRERWLAVGIMGTVIVISMLAAVIFLPQAKIGLTLKTAPLLVEEKIKIAAENQGSPNTIAGTSFFREVDVQGQVTVQGKETIGQKAKGTVRLVNRSFDEQKIVERSRLVTADDRLFYLTGSVTIPAASGNGIAQATAQVEADTAGVEGNIEPQRLNFAALDESARSLVYAEAVSAFTGGSGEEVQVVVQEDVEAARKAAAEVAKSQIEVDVRNELPQGWALLEESWSADMSDFKTQPAVGERVTELNYQSKVTMRVFGYEQKALEDALAKALESRLKGEYMLFPGPISFSKSVDNMNWETGEATLIARVTHTTIPKFSLDTLTGKLAGQSENGAKQYLEGLPGAQSAKIELWPFWVRSIPRITSRINLDLQPERQP